MNKVYILCKDIKDEDSYTTEIITAFKDAHKASIALGEVIRNDPNSAYNKKDYEKVLVFYYVQERKLEE